MFAGHRRVTGLALGVVMVLIPLVNGGGPAAADPLLAASAAASTAVSAPALVPMASRVPTVAFTSGPKLGVRVRPAQVGPGAWKFTLQREVGTKWVSAGAYRTIGTLEEAELSVGEGTYRVVVPAQNGFRATVSGAQRYSPAPTVKMRGGSRLETTVAPVSMRGAGWTMTLERKSAQGWSKVRTVTSNGVRPVVSAVDSGTYRVQTQAQGRFPAFTSTPFAYQQQAPAGPVDYALIEEAFPSDSKTRSMPRASSGGCGSVATLTGDGLKIAGGFLALVPVAGGAMGAVTKTTGIIIGAEGAQAGNACVQAEFAAINVQLAFQESQIESLQAQLQATTSAIIQGAYVLQSGITGAAAYDYSTATSSVGGTFNTFMLDGGFWLGPQTPNPNASVPSSASTTQYFSSLQALADAQTSFVANLSDVSGANVPCSGALLPPSDAKSDPDCYEKVTTNSGSALINLDKTMATQLQSQILVNRNAGANIVPLFDQYNQGIASFYQQSVSALQQAFMMEYTINQLNYYNGAAEIQSLGEVPGTYYSFPSLKEELGNTAPTPAQQASYYNRAQKALAQVYAARVNQLYLNSIGFVVTDVPISGVQSYPPSQLIPKNGSVPAYYTPDYSTAVGTYVTSAPGVTASTPIGMLPSITTNGAGWTANAALYQYSGLRNIQVCAASLEAYNAVNGSSGVLTGPTGALNETTCPSMLIAAGGVPVSAPQFTGSGASCAFYASPQNTAGDGSCYDGNSLIPYFGQSGQVTLGSAVINNLMLCDDSDPTLTQFEVGAANAGNLAGLTAGDPALTCANWGQTGSNNFPGSNPPLFWSDESTVPESPSWATPDPGLWPIVKSSYGGSSYVIDSGYYYPPGRLTAVPYQFLAPPLNIGGLNNQTAVNSGSNNYGANVSFPKSSSGACSVVWMGDSGVNHSTSGSNCNLYFSGVNLKCEQQATTTGCLNYSTQYTAATIGVRLPNAATGSLDGGFVLPLSIGTFGGYPITLGGSPYCAGECTLIDMWVIGKTTIANQGFTTSCPTTVNSVGQAVTATNSYGLAVPCSIVLPDGGMYEISVGRTNNGTGTFQVTPTTGLGTPW